MRRLWGLAIVLAAGSGLWADQDGPGRGVARVSLINGDITMQRGDSGDWIAAAVNAPLVSGDKIFAARASRAEVQLDHANFLRIGENTEVRLADLEGHRYQVQVSRGIATYRILRGGQADVEINTPTVAVRPRERGIYRVEVLPTGETEVTVRDGEAEIFSNQGTETLHEGRTMIVRQGPGDRDLQVQVVRAGGRDDWDRWNERRDEYLQRSRSYRYIHPSIYGGEDLDDYGSWSDVDGYGPCWFPRPVYAGWSPYSYGRWVWIDWYGWTWVGYEPWGWAPYHYGRWFFHAGFGWGWYPGPIYARSYWSPALVGFFGLGRHSGVSIGFGYSRIGWVPLAPGEPYYPWYGRGYYGGRNRVLVDNSVRVTNVTNITNVYRNSRASGGLVSVNTEEFGRGRVSNPGRVNIGDVRDAGQIRGIIPVTPQKESLRLVDRDVQSAGLPPRDGREMRFFTRREPTPVERVPFAEQQKHISQALRGPGNPASVQAGSAPETTTGSRRMNEERPGQKGPLVEDRGGFRRMGEDRAASTIDGPQKGAPVEQRSTGWRRVGEERRSSVSSDAALTQKGNDKRVERDSGSWRRLGDGRQSERIAPVNQQHGSKPGVVVAPQREQKQFDGGAAYRRSEPSREFRSETPREERRVQQESSGRGRPLEIKRPMMVERSHDSGRGSAQPSHQNKQPSGGGGGKQVERSVGR